MSAVECAAADAAPAPTACWAPAPVSHCVAARSPLVVGAVAPACCVVVDPVCVGLRVDNYYWLIVPDVVDLALLGAVDSLTDCAWLTGESDVRLDGLLVDSQLADGAHVLGSLFDTSG